MDAAQAKEALAALAGLVKAAKDNGETAGGDLGSLGPTAVVAEIKFVGDKLIIPEGMSFDQAIALIKRRQKYLEETCKVVEDFDYFPWDGANALDKVLTTRFGFAPAEATPGFFGPTPPALISIQVGFNQVHQVPWGAFSLPGVDGKLNTAVHMKGKMIGFRIIADIKRKDEATVRSILSDVRKYLATNSIYRGQAVKIRFKDDDGHHLEMPEVEFMDTASILPEQLIYSAEVEGAIETNLFTPIRRIRELSTNGIPVKRSVTLYGTYGTGKTLAALVAAKVAAETGVTYIYCASTAELPEAIQFAKQYADPGAVVFGEDIDRVTAGQRTLRMDELLNIVDGMDTKNANIITVFTTNAIDTIEPAMLRTGRMDAIIEVTPPDADAVERLLRHYGGASIEPTEALRPAAQVLAGQIPATIAEVVKRAKLSQLKLQAPGTQVTQITGAALLDAAHAMRIQLELLAKRIAERDEPKPTIDSLMREIVVAGGTKTAKAA